MVFPNNKRYNTSDILLCNINFRCRSFVSFGPPQKVWCRLLGSWLLVKLLGKLEPRLRLYFDLKRGQ